MSALSLVPIAVNVASHTSLAESRYFGVAQLGADIIGSRLFKLIRVLDKVRKVYGEDAAREMVSRMRADVARDTGRLYNGIEYFGNEDGGFTVQASAVHEDRNGGEDYAGFVERGTRAGQRGHKVSYVADSAYHDLTAGIGSGTLRETGQRKGRARLQYRDHPGTPAQPFFFDNAREVLSKRRADAAASVAKFIGASAGASELRQYAVPLLASAVAR